MVRYLRCVIASVVSGTTDAACEVPIFYIALQVPALLVHCCIGAPQAALAVPQRSSAFDVDLESVSIDNTKIVLKEIVFCYCI